LNSKPKENMATREEYLQAIEVIKNYNCKNGSDNIILPSGVLLPNLKRNQFIEITKETGFSKKVKVGKVFRVVSSELSFFWLKNGLCFFNFLDKKYVNRGRYDFKDIHKFNLDLLEWGGHFEQKVLIDLGDLKYFKISSKLHGYKVVENINN